MPAPNSRKPQPHSHSLWGRLIASGDGRPRPGKKGVRSPYPEHEPWARAPRPAAGRAAVPGSRRGFPASPGREGPLLLEQPPPPWESRGTAAWAPLAVGLGRR